MLSDAMKKATKKATIRHFLREAKRLLVNADSDEKKRLLAIMEAFKAEEAKMKGVI